MRCVSGEPINNRYVKSMHIVRCVPMQSWKKGSKRDPNRNLIEGIDFHIYSPAVVVVIQYMWDIALTLFDMETTRFFKAAFPLFFRSQFQLAASGSTIRTLNGKQVRVFYDA